MRENLRDLGRILHFNAEHGIAFYRVGSRVVPFASDPGNAVAWWDEFSGELERLGQFVRRYGLRLEMHPGHHCLLNAPSPETVALSVLELGWHVRFFDAMQLDASHKLVLRVGGTFGDKAGSLARFACVINGLPDDWKSRLVLENDEAHYRLADVFEASKLTSLPVVVGWLAHRESPSPGVHPSAGLARAFQTWKSPDGSPIVHLGSPSKDPSSRITYADWVEPSDLEHLSALAPPEVGFDCLLEATQGDRALFDLRERMAIRERRTLSQGVGSTPSPIV